MRQPSFQKCSRQRSDGFEMSSIRIVTISISKWKRLTRQLLFNVCPDDQNSELLGRGNIGKTHVSDAMVKGLLVDLPSASCHRTAVFLLLVAHVEDNPVGAHDLYQAQDPSAHSCHCCILSREEDHSHLRAAFVLSTVEVRAFAVAGYRPDHTVGGGHSPARSFESILRCLHHMRPKSSRGRNRGIPALGRENVPPLVRNRCIHLHSAAHQLRPANPLLVAHVGVKRFGAHLGEHHVELAGRSILVLAGRRSEQPARMPFC